jgi:hypothetical protein
MIHIERDEKVNLLEKEINNRIMEIYKGVEPKEMEVINKNDISFVGVEDAIKELLELGVEI